VSGVTIVQVESDTIVSSIIGNVRELLIVRARNLLPTHTTTVPYRQSIHNETITIRDQFIRFGGAWLDWELLLGRVRQQAYNNIHVVVVIESIV
jgi:hypothetical protein